MKSITKSCLNCGKKFQAPLREIKRGNGKYCCLSCAMQYIGKNRSKPTPNVTCATCGKPFYKSASKMQNSKSGLFFCCRKHHDEAQRLGKMAHILRPDWGNGEGSYRKIAFLNHSAVCNRCGYAKHKEVLQVHHIDRNHNNSNPKNLEILCPTCHEVEHLLAEDGRHSSKK